MPTVGNINGVLANLEAMKSLADIMIERAARLDEDDLLVARIEARLLRAALQNWVEEWTP